MALPCEPAEFAGECSQNPSVGKYLSGRSERLGVSRLGVVLVVCLVLMAGCSGLSGGDETADREPYGVEEPVNASVEEDEPEELLPGLTTEELANTHALREAHEEAIGNQSYTIEAETVYVTEEGNETVREVVEATTYVDPEAGIVHEIQSYTGADETGGFVDQQNQTIEQWIGEEFLFRVEYENGTVEYMPTPVERVSVEERIEQLSLRLLDPLQTVEETTTTGAVESTDGTYYVVEGQQNASNEIGQSGGIQETEARTLIRDDGLIRQTVTEQTIGEGDERTVVEGTTEIIAIGETTVERPGWYEEGIEAQPEELDSDGPAGEDGAEGNESADEGNPEGADDDE